jgi:nicotinate-nucleotide adenylyltransferase
VILNNHRVYVYPRVLTPQEENERVSKDTAAAESVRAKKNIVFCHDAPVMKVSSSFIREAIKDKKDVRYLLTETVFKYVDEMNFYK